MNITQVPAKCKFVQIIPRFVFQISARKCLLSCPILNTKRKGEKALLLSCRLWFVIVILRKNQKRRQILPGEKETLYITIYFKKKLKSEKYQRPRKGKKKKNHLFSLGQLIIAPVRKKCLKSSANILIENINDSACADLAKFEIYFTTKLRTFHLHLDLVGGKEPCICSLLHHIFQPSWLDPPQREVQVFVITCCFWDLQTRGKALAHTHTTPATTFNKLSFLYGTTMGY